MTDVERRLVDHVTRGEPLDLAGDKPVDEAAMRSWDDSRTVQAVMLRDILRGRLAPDPDPHGLRLRGARIDGRLDLENLTTRLWLELSDCLLGEGVVARDAQLPGLVLSGCRLEHATESPLDAERLTTPVLVLDEAVITAKCEAGAVRLVGARLGMLRCAGATMRNDSGPALAASNLQVDRVLLHRGFEAVGAGEDGAVRLRGAHVGRQLDCTGARKRNDSGPALVAESLRVDQDVFLQRGFEAVGAREGGAVRLIGAHVGGFLDCEGARIRNDFGPALVAESLRVDQDVFLLGFEAVGAGKGVTLDLSRARIGGMLVFAPAGLEHAANPQARLALDGLTYAGLPMVTSPPPAGIPGEWLALLREATPGYAAQPYQQLASAHRAAGDDAKVRTTLMAQRRDQIDRGAPTKPDWFWAWVTGKTLGYGYQPWRALIGLALVAAISAVLAVTLGAHGGLAHTNPQPPTATQCSLGERVAVGLDLGLPLVTTGTRAHCEPTASRSGQLLTVAGWGLQLLAWAFATLFIAGFTGAVRKT